MHSLTNPALAQPALPPIADDGRTLYVSGLQALRDGNTDEAIYRLTQALRRSPEHSGMRRNLVRALLVAERWDQVAVQATAALAGAPDNAELHFARGTALNALGQHTQACAAFARALTLQPDHAAAWLNMGNASADLDDLASAEAQYRTAISLDPVLAEAHASLGYLLTQQGRLPEAIAACEAALRVRPDFVQAHWNLAIATLLGGDLRAGFAAYEWRTRHARYQADFPPLPGRRWDGSDPTGLTILVRAEQGYGDAIQFARYLPMIRAAGGRPVLVCAPALVPLMRLIPGMEAIATADPVPPHDAWIDQASLPYLFGTTLATIPTPAGYLQADPARVAAWQARLPPGRKVGVAFVGNPRHPADRRRSIPAELTAILLTAPGVTFINLHHGEAAQRLNLTDLTPWLTDYAETAALIETLDLVVTVDTSVAHLAGALGKPVWILLPHAPDWRWLLERDNSPWYHSARLFRQAAAGDWRGPLQRIRAKLEPALLSAGPHPHCS
jgi:tetratricopeptide (TPR) repeat protein